MDNITASGAEKIQKEDIAFTSSAHEKFYYEKLKETRCQDVYHKALCYCLGICDDTRKNIYNIYGFKTGCLHESWQTSRSMKVVRMAFDLYCNGTPGVFGYRYKKGQIYECRNIQWRICPAVYTQVQ